MLVGYKIGLWFWMWLWTQCYIYMSVSFKSHFILTSYGISLKETGLKTLYYFNLCRIISLLWAVNHFAMSYRFPETFKWSFKAITVVIPKKVCCYLEGFVLLFLNHFICLCNTLKILLCIVPSLCKYLD